MKRDYFLQTKRIGFSTWQPEDVELARLLWGNPEVTKYICASGQFTEEEITLRLQKELAKAMHKGDFKPIVRGEIIE